MATHCGVGFEYFRVDYLSMNAVSRLFIISLMACSMPICAASRDDFNALLDATLAVDSETAVSCPLYGAAFELKRNNLRKMLSMYDYQEDYLDALGNNVMVYAVTSDDLGLAQEFAAKGASLTKLHDGTLFHVAATFASVPVLEFLLSKGINPEGRAESGATPFMTAVADDRIPVAKWFVAHGANINAETNSGASALIYSLVCKDKEMIRYLLKNGAIVNEKAVKLGLRMGIDLEREIAVMQHNTR
jgi:hypothetical protein